jgi:hypothetical protein
MSGCDVRTVIEAVVTAMLNAATDEREWWMERLEEHKGTLREAQQLRRELAEARRERDAAHDVGVQAQRALEVAEQERVSLEQSVRDLREDVAEWKHIAKEEKARADAAAEAQALAWRAMPAPKGVPCVVASQCSDGAVRLWLFPDGHVRHPLDTDEDLGWCPLPMPLPTEPVREVGT